MVDALNRTRRWLRPDGRLIDLHPTSEEAQVEVRSASGSTRVGDVWDQSDATGPGGRHAAAGIALADVIARGWFDLESRRTFTFATEAKSTDEIDAHLRAKWRAASLEAGTRARADAQLEASPGGRVRVVEQVEIARLMPLAVF